jgi:hypothetical protein
MSNNVTGSPGTLVPIVGPGGRLPIGPTTRNAPLTGTVEATETELLGARVSPPAVNGMWPVPLSAAINSQARGTDPRARHSVPGQPAATFPG